MLYINTNIILYVYRIDVMYLVHMNRYLILIFSSLFDDIQGIGFTLVGLALQFADGLVFVFLGKLFTCIYLYMHTYKCMNTSIQMCVLSAVFKKFR
jgi:hypothetical protein